VEDHGCEQDIGLQQPLELLPAHGTLAAAATQPVLPRRLRDPSHGWIGPKGTSGGISW
jgi:hypothetical protein